MVNDVPKAQRANGIGKKKREILILLVSLFFIIPLCFIGYVYISVNHDAEMRIQRGVVESVIASESPVYYDDGRTPIGVFFEKTHRKYICYNDIPKVFIKALIAAEDRNYFNHKGIDPRAVARAFLANLKAGKVVQGGSTLTQQAAKNIFRREKRSYSAKFKELIQAFLFERKYSKEEILEMYSNQFFVNGYGKGLGIAAQYYFGKEVENLGLVEAAFIAGSVKGPTRYNPFIKKTEVEKNEARRLAKVRKDYVLKSMLDLNFITKTRYEDAKKKEIPFKEGKITYRLNVILDYVREQLESEYFQKILHEQGVDNIATSGIAVYTSINKDIQEAALLSLRSHLPVLDVKLNGYKIEQSPDKRKELIETGLEKPTGNLPFLSRITHIDTNRGDGCMAVSWDHGGGIIDYNGLKPMGEAWLNGKPGGRIRFEKKYVRMFLKNFHVGDLVSVQALNSTEDGNKTRLILSKIPELQGGIVVLQNGMIKAMVGGYFNRFFNRAVDAKRQLGSIFKPLIYTAALQLKWNSLDPLLNVREMFNFENVSYIPRPDHDPQSRKVSMVWAGAKSENLATVWLLYHLTDHLNRHEFRQVVDIVGLGRKRGESYLEYKARIRDRYGVVVNNNALKEAAFEESKKEIESDIIFGGYEKMLKNLNRLKFNIDSKRLNSEEPWETRVRRLSFKRLQALNQKMKAQFHDIPSLIERYRRYKTIEVGKKLADTLRYFFRTDSDGRSQKIIYTKDPEAVSTARLIPVTPEWMIKNTSQVTKAEIRIDGLITSEALDWLQENLKKNYRRLLNHKRYDMEVLNNVRDFRTLVNLSYVVRLTRELGVSTKLDPVLSFPLGPNSISILEAARVYQAIMNGKTYSLSGANSDAMVPVINKIVDRYGDLLWEYKPQPKKVLTNRVSRLITGILGKVMETGTGRSAGDKLKVSLGDHNEKINVSIPSFGKTGTSNRFTNSSFVGFIPTPDTGTGMLNTEDGYVIACYVGYDDNRPMKSEHMTVYGASGALPIWIDTANAILNSRIYKKNLLQPADLVFNPLMALEGTHEQMQPLSVSPVTGLPLHLNRKRTIPDLFPKVMAEVQALDDGWQLKRTFEPINQGTGRK